MKTEKQGGITNVSTYSLDRIEAWCKEKCDDDGIWGLLEGHFKAVRLAQAPRVEEVTVSNLIGQLHQAGWFPHPGLIETIEALYPNGLKITTGEGEKR